MAILNLPPSRPPLLPLAPIERRAHRLIATRLVNACRRSASPARWSKLELAIAYHLDAACRTRGAALATAALALGIDPASAAEAACSCARTGAVIAVVSTLVGASLGAIAVGMVKQGGHER